MATKKARGSFKGVSIILPVWNQKNFAHLCLDSIKKHTKYPYELIIIDNGSRKDTREFLKNYPIKKKLIRNEKNLGWCRALNQGIKASKGKYVLFLNSDTIVTHNWLTKMVAHFQGNVGIVGPTSNFVSGLQSLKNNQAGVKEQVVNWLIGFCFLIKKSVLDKVKEKDWIDERFSPGGSEELDLCIRVKYTGHRMVIARDVFIQHFGSKSLSQLKEYNPAKPMEFFNPRLKLLEEKWGKKEVEAINIQKCPKIAICIPTYGQSNHLFVTRFPYFLQNCFQHFGFNNILFLISPRTVIHIARELLIEDALRYGAEYVFFLDDDMLPPDRILPELVKAHKDIVCGLAYRRTTPYFPCIFRGKDSQGKCIPVEVKRRGLVEIDSCGMACTLINTKIFKKLKKPWFAFTQYGEDISFCQKVKKKGFGIWCDTDEIVPHIGFERLVTDVTRDTYLKNLK